VLPATAALFSITPFIVLLGLKIRRRAIGLRWVVRTVMMAVRMLTGALTEVSRPDEQAQRDHGNGPEQHQQLFEGEAHPVPGSRNYIGRHDFFCEKRLK
jgi:hypothetical protein